MTGCLIGSSGLDGIVIEADDVTLDLNGFTLSGVPGSLNGISIPNRRRNVVIEGGTLRGWGENGVNGMGTAIESRYESLRVFDCGADGLRAGAGSVVVGCLAANNVDEGIHVTDDCTVTQRDVFGNNRDGLQALGANNLILGNRVGGNGADFNIGSGNAFGPLVAAAGAGDLGGVAGADHPLANLVR